MTEYNIDKNNQALGIEVWNNKNKQSTVNHCKDGAEDCDSTVHGAERTKY